MFNFKNIEAMKKSYMMPAIKVVKLHTANLMETSQIGVKQEAVSNVSGDSRRGGSSWDDDEE